MRLYFLRHGIAEDRRPGLADGHRRLTDEGIAEMRRVARGMRVLQPRFTHLWTSPLRRARETAEIAAEALDQKDRLEERDVLGSGCHWEELAPLLAELPGNARVLLVGHEPDMSSLIAAAIGGGAVRMKKASLACVELHRPQRGGGDLRWLLEAEQLGQLKDD